MGARSGVLPAELISFVSNPSTEPFWAAAREHRLVVPRCSDCGAFRLPPAPFCWRCRSQVVEWVDHDGDGELYSYTVLRHAVIPFVADALPIVIGVVELPGTGGCRLIGNVVGCPPEGVRIGMPLALDWYDVVDDAAAGGSETRGSVPCFRPRA
jgi:uncharacterized OB-fold protein